MTDDRDVVRARLDQISEVINGLVERCAISLPVDYASITPTVIIERVSQIRNLSIEVTKSMAMLQRALKISQHELAVANAELKSAERVALDTPRVQAGADANARKARAEAVAMQQHGHSIQNATAMVAELTANLEVLRVVHGELAQARQDLRTIVDTLRVQVALETS